MPSRPAAASPSVGAQCGTCSGLPGAGLLFRRGAHIQGLTTAAGIWCVAAIGMAAGTGLWRLAIVVTVIILLVLKVSDHFSKQLRSQVFRDAHWSVRLTVANPATISDIRDIIASLAPTASRPLPDIGHWVVGQKKGLPTITLMLNDTEMNQLVPVFESHEDISKIRIQATD